MQGYDISRFNPQPPPHLVCLVCKKVVREPFECNYCGQMYCATCVESKPQCVSQDCTPGQQPNYIKISGAMLKVYKNLQLCCSNPECKKLMAIIDIDNHSAQCNRIKCPNFDVCQDFIPNNDKQQKFCSIVCELTSELFENGTDFKKQYEIIKKFLPKISNNDPQQKQLQTGFQNLSIRQNIVIEEVINFKWDRNRCGSGIQLLNGDMGVFLKESSYIFRTVLADKPFESGIHYWEIEADSRTENELKIGVCQGNAINLNAAFCDLAQGFAYYGLAQLRNGSNASGSTYGKRFKKEGVLGVCLNMINGTLSFSLNGEFMGVAFRSEILKKGPIYAAVALLHCAGCTLKTGKAKPANME